MSQIKEVKPKIITLNTPCIRNQRTLICLQKQEQYNWSKWDAVVTSLDDYYKWSKYASIVGIILEYIPIQRCHTFHEELFKLSPHVPIICLSNDILKTKSQEYWADNYDNIVQLDMLHEDYPYLGHAWNHTRDDAVAMFAHLCRYNRIVDCTVSEARMTTFQGNITVENGIFPPGVWLVTQYFRHSDEERAKEILECLQRNAECADINTIILLTERDYSKDWQHLRTNKIKQFVMKKRLTYAHFIQFVKDRVPKNTFAILANADIFMDKLTDLWKINLKNAMFSLLRWDVKDLDNLATAEVFGPRADSQDAWIVLSDSVKDVKWNYDPLNIQLGQPGCDNAFAGQMLQNRFVLYNPALTLKTYHLHKTEIRNYTKADTIRAKLYINLVPSYIIDTKQEKMTDPIHTFSNETVAFEIKSSSLSNEITYCTMLEKDGRYKWEPSVENYYFDEIEVHHWSNACVTPNGLVYTPYMIYPGDDEKYPYWNTSNIHILTPLQKTEQMIAIPLPNTTIFMNPDTYILYYLSRVLRFLKQFPNASFWVPEEYAEYLQDFNITSKPLFVSNDSACYANEVIGCVPGASEIGKEEIAILREHLPLWAPSPVHKRCVVVGEFHHKKQLGEILYKDWFIEFQDDARFDSLIGASLCILVDKPFTKIWALPKGATFIEFQQELEMTGENQHLAHVCELQSWVLLLSKGPVQQVQQQIMKELNRWFTKNEDTI